MNADSEETGKNMKLQIHVCNALHNREWLQIEDITEKIRKVVHNLYKIWQTVKKQCNCISNCFFSSKPYFKSHEKTKTV